MEPSGRRGSPPSGPRRCHDVRYHSATSAADRSGSRRRHGARQPARPRERRLPESGQCPADPRSELDPEVPDAAADPAGDAAGGHDHAPGGKPVDYYEISMRQFAQQILPAGLPATTVWGYGGGQSAQSKRGLLVHNAPSLTIEAQWNRPVRVKWINDLVDANGNYLPHLLPVDPTLHWANPPGGTDGRDTRPTFTDDARAVHRPGADRHPRPRRRRRRRRERRLRRGLVPARRRTTSRPATPRRAPGTTSSPARPRRRYGVALGARVRHLPVPERAPGVDDLVPRPRARDDPAQRVRRAGGLLPHPRRPRRRRRRARQPDRAPAVAARAGAARRTTSSRPTRPTTRSRSRSRTARSTADGSLFYPTPGRSSTSIAGPYIPDTDVSPIWNPEFFGNMIMVNGNTWPFQTVEQRRYRFRVLNGCQSRFLILDFNADPGRRGVGDRQRGRLPRRAGQPHRRATATGC